MATRKAAPSAATPVESSITPVIDTQMFEKTVADLKQGVETATAAGAAASAKALKTAKDVVAFNQGSIEAFTQSGKIFATGSQELLREFARSSKVSFDETVAGFRALISAKTPKEQLALQMSLVRTSTLWAVSESTRLAQASIELASKTAAPLTARAVLAAETIAATKV